MRPQYIAFHEAFDLLRKDYNKNKKYLNDKRVTFSERQILRSYIALRNNKFDETLDLMSNCTPQNDYFEGHKNLVMGIAYNNISEFKKSKVHFELSESQFDKEQDSYFLFYLYLNWYYLATNTADSDLAQSLIDKTQVLELKSKRFMVLRDLIHFDFYSNLKDYEKAKDYLTKVKDNKRFLYAADIGPYLIMSFNYYMFTEQFSDGEKVIEQLKKIRKYQLTENFKFMSSLMGYLLHDKSIYLREEDLDRTKVLNFQAQTVKYLSYGNIPDAIDFWDKLTEMNPKIYQDEFEYHGPGNLFSHCLKKAKFSVKKIPEQKLEGLGLEDKLNTLFVKDGDLYLKEDLFFLLYGVEAQSSKDLNKLSKLISRFRKKSCKNIITSHNSYVFKEITKKSA